MPKENCGKNKALHGNSAKIDPSKKIVGEYIANTVTMSSKHEHGTPIANEKNVEYAKRFVEENKK